MICLVERRISAKDALLRCAWFLPFIMAVMSEVTIAGADDPAKVATSTDSRRAVVVLHSDLTPPARLARLRHAAKAVSLDLQLVAVDSVDAAILRRQITEARL